MYYGGIGARKTPIGVCGLMTEYAGMLEHRGYTLRSGGATGADTAFEIGCEKHQIFLPKKGFNGRQSELYPETCDIEILRASIKIAKEFYGAYNWRKASENTRRFMTRNVWQVLGFDLVSPSKFVVCWTPSGFAMGGTGQAIRIANHYEIPVYNLKTDIDKFENEVL